MLIYRLALETGMRAKELTSLRVASFVLGSARPTVTLEAAYSKHRREDVMPLRLPIAAAMREHFAARPASSRAFAIPRHWRQSEMLAADRAAAGIPIVDEEGRVADFHVLRHTFITSLSRAGVNPKVAQSLARHSSIVLTMDHTTHLRVDDDRLALEALPFGREAARDALDATGTEGRSVFPPCLLSRGGSGETSVDSRRGSRPLEPR